MYMYMFVSASEIQIHVCDCDLPCPHSTHVLEPDGGLLAAEDGGGAGEGPSAHSGDHQTHHQLLW